MRPEKLKYRLLVADLLWLVVSATASLPVRSQDWVFSIPNWFFVTGGVLTAACAIWTVLFVTLRLDGFDGGWNVGAVSSRMLVAGALFNGIMYTCAYMTVQRIPRAYLVTFSVVFFFGVLICRWVARRLCDANRRHLRRMIVVGDGRIARELATCIERHPEMRCEIVGFVSATSGGRSEPTETGSVLASAADTFSTHGILQFIKQQNVSEIAVATSSTSRKDLLPLVSGCRSAGVRVSFVPEVYELYVSKPRFIDIDGLPLVTLETAEFSPFAAAVKRMMDVVISVLLAIPAVPVLLVAASVLKASGRRVFQVDDRCGRQGKTFRMVRLNIPREATDLPSQLDIIQRLSISELPQLWNVLKGDMGLVGPRPEPPSRVKHYSEWQRRRLQIRPGLTGLAQVRGLREHHSSDEKSRCDLQYMLHWNPAVDVALILQTIITLAGRLVPRRAPSPSVPPVELSFLAMQANPEVMNVDSAQSGTD